jgi:hypothetical protein
MKKNGNRLIAVAVVAVLAATLLGVFAALRWMITGIVGFDEKMAVAIIAACTTVIVSVVTVVYTQQKTKTREIDNSHRPQKVEIYKQFMDKAVVGLLKPPRQTRSKALSTKRNWRNSSFLLLATSLSGVRRRLFGHTLRFVPPEVTPIFCFVLTTCSKPCARILATATGG